MGYKVSKDGNLTLDELGKEVERLRAIKKEKLEHYAMRDPHRFQQFDGFLIPENEADDIMRPDKDGDWMSAGETYELMTGNPNIRVLITPGTTEETAIRMLGKIAKWIKESGVNLEHTPQPSIENITELGDAEIQGWVKLGPIDRDDCWQNTGWVFCKNGKFAVVNEAGSDAGFICYLEPQEAYNALLKAGFGHERKLETGF